MLLYTYHSMLRNSSIIRNKLNKREVLHGIELVYLHLMLCGCNVKLKLCQMSYEIVTFRVSNVTNITHTSTSLRSDRKWQMAKFACNLNL